MISDMVATTAANGMLSEDLNNVLKQLQDSLGVENNEQLKKELARYAEVYGSAAVGDKEGKTDEVFSRRNLVSSDYYENANDVENRAQRFEDLIQNLGGTKAEARKLLEEVAEENINDKNEGFNSSLAKAKQAREEGNTDVYDSEVRHMTDRVKSMVMKMQDITEGLRSNMNKGATTDSKGFLSDDKFTIQYGNEKDSSRRGEKAQFRTSFKKEAFNYSTRGGLFKTTDQIASEARYMAEQLDSLNLSDKQKADIKQQLDLLQEYENDINHMGYELHRGIRRGFNYEADTDGEAVLSEGETAKIKGAMEDYFHQYVTPNTGEKRLSPKEAVDLKKYVNTLSLGQLKAFQKSLDKQKDSIAYEGVSAAIKARESAKGIAASHAKWRGTHYQNGKYIRSLVKTTQTTEKGNEAKIDNMVNGTHVDAINNANILEAHHEQLQQRIAKLEAKKNRTKREEKKLNELKAKLKSTKERLGTLERVSDARAKTIYNQNVKAILENPTKISELIAQVYNANKAQDAKVNVRAIEKAIKMLRDTLHDASSMETDKAKLKDAKKALELLDKLLKRAEKTDRVLEGRDTIIHKLIDICSKENLRNLSDINFLKALKQSMEKFKDKLGDRLEAYKGPYKEALYNLAYKIRLIERSDEKLARGIIYDINHNGDLDDLKSRAVDYEKKIAKLQARKSLSPEEQKTLDRYKQYSSAIAKQTKKLEDRANEFENKLPDRPDIFAINDIDELEDLDRTVVNSLAQLYDLKSEFYGNKLAIQKVMEVRKDIQAKIAELSEKQDASESPQNGSELTETGQDEQSTTDTQEGSQNGSEGSETVFEDDASVSKSLENLKTKYSTALGKAGLEKEQVNAVVEVLINNAKILADAFGMSVEDYLNTRFAGFQNMSQKEFEEKYSDVLYQDAWHGSPFDFNEFKTSAIGTGEGAQIHGWGLYFAASKDISEAYRKRLTNSVKVLYKGEDIANDADLFLTLSQIYNLINTNTIKDQDTLQTELAKELDILIKDEQEFFDAIKNDDDQSGSEFVDEKLKYLNDLKDNINEFKYVKNEDEKGQLFKVDIPENDVLLDEGLKLNKQPKKVIEAIKQIPPIKKIIDTNPYYLEQHTGRNLYDKLIDFFFEQTDTYKEIKEEYTGEKRRALRRKLYEARESQIGPLSKQASLLLNNYGIEGITYEGGRDGRCFVVFDDKAVKVLEKYYQRKRGQEAKGATTISANQSLITLFEKGDVSTALHETSHFFLNEVRELIKSGKAPKWMQSVWSTLQNQYSFDGLLDGTDNKSVKSWTRVQERFARDFEAYMREGKAPKPELQSIFDACKKWLKAIYKTIRSLLGKNKLSPEIRQAFDALFTGEFKGDENVAVESALETLNVWHATGENANLSNLALRPFDYEGRHYQSVEHAYQSLKSGSFDEAIYNDPRWSNAGTKIQGRKGTDKKTNLQLMKNLILESFKQNDSAREELLATGNAKFTHKRPNGSNGIWETEFPRILEEVREELKDYQPEIDNSDVYTLEQNLQQFLDTYQEIDESLLPEDIRNILTEISDRMDEVSKYANDPAISKYYGTLQKLYHDYEQLLKEAVANDNSSVSTTSTSTSIDVTLPELSSDPKEAAIEAQIQEVIKKYWNLDPDQPSGYFAKAIDEILDAYGLTAKLSAEKSSIYNELYIQLSDQYNTAFYEALDREAEAKRNKRDKIENTPRENETTEQLRKRLIVGGTEETDEADSEAEQERKYHQLHFPKHITSRWSQKALNGAFRDIKNIRNIFGAKESSMTLHGLPDSIIPDNWRDYQDDPESPLYRDAPLGKLVALAVDSLSKILVTYHFSKDTPLTRWDSKKKKYVPITELNGILNNVLRNAPHVQLLYQPDLSTMEIGRNYKGFKSSYIMDAMINPNTAVAIILGVAELFANRSVSSIFNPKTNEEIASAFGMNPDNIDPMDLQVFTKVANKYGVFKKNISTTLGHLIMDNLGLKRGNKLEEESYTIYDNSVAALGNVGLLLAEELGFITSTRVYTGEFPTAPSPTASQQEKDAFQREVSKYLKSRHLDELDITPEQAVHLGLGQSNVRYFYKYNESQETDNAVKELWLGPVVDTADKGEYLGDSAPVYTREEKFGAKSFKAGRDTLTRTPLLNAKDVHNSPTRRKQPNFKLTENRMRVLNEESKAPYYINTPILDEILKTCDGNETKMRKLLLTRMGWDSRIEDDDFDDLSYDEKTKIKGKNENLERELDAFLDYARLQKDLESEGKFFGYFFRYFGSANGRSFMDTNTLNPQTSKAFPRFLCQPETTYQAYDLNDANDIQCELFAVAQAFDCLKSYYSSKENESRNGVSLAGKLLGLDVVNGDIADIQKRLETLRGIQRDLILNDSDTNADKYSKIGWNGGFENFGQAVVAIDHCVRRLEAVLAKGGKTEGATISSYLSVENDSTTSGYVIKFLLMPLDKDLLAEYGLKIGYLNHALIQNNPNFSSAFKERIKGYTSIDQLKADPEFLDIYKTGAVEMVNEYESMKREAEKKQETLGEVAFNSLCTVESNDKEDDTRELNSFGKKVDNAGIDAVDVDRAIKTVEAAIPHPEKDPKTGLWKVSSVLRNLMKPIIMIFGYNASNESCEKRFGEAVMDEHIKIFVNLYNKQGIYGSKGKAVLAPIAYDLYKGKRSKEEIDAIFNFMTDIAQRVTGYKNQKSAIDKLVKALRAKSPYAIKFKSIARDQVGVYNTISVAEWYKLVVGGTFGKAVTKFLDKKFGAYGKANRHLNNASKITFKLYSHVRNALIKQRLAKLIEQDGNPDASDAAKSRIQSLKKKYASQVAKNGNKLSVNFMGISDLKTREVRVIDNICRPLLPVFQMPETDADKVNPKTGAVVSTNIRSVDTASADLSNSSAATPIKSRDIDGNSMPEYVPRSDNEADGYKFENDTLNSYGDITEFSSGDRMLAVLLIHFVDGVLAEHTMDHMLQLKKYLTVIHDAFVLSAKDGKFLDQGFNEALAKVCEYFNPFEIVAIALNQMKKTSLEICEKNGIPDFDFRAPLNPKRFGSKLFNPTYGQVQHEVIELSKLVRNIKREIFNSNDQIILANLGGDTGGQYTIAGTAKVPGVGNEVSTLTAQEKAQAESSALGSRASAWKDKYDIQRIEQEANSSKEGRAKIFQSLNEWDEAEGPVKNDEEYLKQAQELLNEINPERFTNLQYEEAVSQQDAEAKGVYFTGRDGSQRRVTVIKPTAIANEADRKNRLASRQLSAAAVYMHEMIHPAVSEAIANPDLYGVTREVSVLREFYNAVADKIDYTFFRPDNYDSLTEAEKKLADESAQKYYDYMFNSTDKDTLGGFQEFIANALSDPRMIKLLKGMDASAYSEEYRGKNFFEKIFYIVKHIFKAMFGNEESKGKVLRTMGTLGLESKRQGSIYDAMRNLTVQISYANAYAANKMQNGKLSKLENVFEALNSAAQVIKPVNDFVSDKIKWAFDLGGVSNRFERTYKSLEEIIRAQGITEGSSKMDTLKTLLMCPFSHNMRVALADTLIDCCSLGQRSTFAHFIRDISDKDDATRQLEGLASLRNNIDRMSRGAGAAYAANILDSFGGTISDEDSIACTKIGVACDLQSLLTNGYSIEEIQKLSSGDGIEEAIASHEAAIAKHYENDKHGREKTTWTRNQCIGLAHFMNTNKGNPAQCLNAYAIARGFLCTWKNDKADEKLIGHIDCLTSLIAMQNADPSHRLAISKMNSKGLKTVLECHRSLIGKAFDAGYIERAHMIKGWHSSIIDDTKDYAVAPVDPATVKAMADDGYKLNTELPVDGMTNAVMGFYIKSVTTPQHRQGAALQITGKRAIGQSLNSFMESNEHIIGDRRDYITRQIKKAHFIRTKMQARMETLDGLSYEDFDNRGLVGSYYTPVISPNGDVTDFRITMFNDFKDAVMNRNNNICDVMSKMAMTNTVKTSAGGQNTNIVHFLIDDMEKNMDPDTHRARRQFENLGEVVLGSKELRNKHDIKYVRVRIDPDSEFAAPDVPAAIIPEEMREAMRRLEKNGDGLWVREDWLYQIFGTPDISLADAKVMQKENMRAAKFGIRLAENIAKAVATLAKVAIVFKKPQVLVGNAVSNYLFHIMNGHNPVTAAAMDTENLQLVIKYMQTEKEINRLDIKKDIGEATASEKAKLNRLRSALENNPIHKLVQAGLFSAVVEDNSKKDQDAMKAMLRYISDNPKMQKIAKSALGDAFDMKTVKGKIAGQLYMREGTPLYDFIYAMTQYSDFVSRCTDYRIGMKQMPESFRGNADMKRKYETALIQQIRDDYINYDSPQSKAMNYVNAVGLTFFTKYFFRIQRVIRRTTTRRPLMAFSMMAANAHFDTPDNIFEQMPLSKNYGAIFHTPWGNAADLVFPPAFGAYNPANWWPF
jgi:predicted NAD-dependent protein-ADP-ribosyltransferase YbiA (DUF1768 family)